MTAHQQSSSLSEVGLSLVSMFVAPQSLCQRTLCVCAGAAEVRVRRSEWVGGLLGPMLGS